MENHQVDLYYTLTLIFLATSIIFRIYSVYHGKNASNWSETRERQQNDFNEGFIKSLN
jgi:preprotein translocase subunit SecG